MDHLATLLEQGESLSVFTLSWVFFIGGLGGSLHCIGMCGGLVSACTKNRGEIASYQIGRLFGYILLGIFSGTLGTILSLSLKSKYTTLIPGLLLGGLFIWWGIATYKGRKIRIPLPKNLLLLHGRIWKILASKSGRIHYGRSAGVGLFSIFLPCGLLYGIVAMVAAFQNPIKGIIGMFFFWLGTLPAMGFAPGLFQNLIRKIFSKSPRIIGIIFILIGILTISWRVLRVVHVSGSPSIEETCH